MEETLCLILSILCSILALSAAGSGMDSMYDFDAFGGMGSYDADNHIREKRKAAGTTYQDTSFQLVKLSGSDTPQIGDVLQYRIDIWLPEVNTTGMELTVEILSSDPETGAVGLALCKPRVTAVGSNIFSINGTNLSAITPQMFYNPTSPQINDKAILEFGYVRNTDTAAAVTANTSSIISIEFCAALVDSDTSITPVYLTAGADYADEMYIWIGQDQLTPNYANRALAYASLVNITTPPSTTTINPGDAVGVAFDAIITYPWARLSFSAFDPDYHDYISISQVGTTFPANSYYIENNMDKAVSYNAEMNFRGFYTSRETSYVPLINMNGASNRVTADTRNKISAAVSFCLSPEALVGDAFSVATAVTIGTSRIFVDIFNFTVGATVATRSPTTPATIDTIALISASNRIPAGGSVTYRAKMKAPATSGWFTATLTVTPPSGFKACGARLEFAGGNLACVPPMDNKTVVINDATGSMVVTFTGKNTRAYTADTSQEEIWLAVTVSGGSTGGAVSFNDGATTKTTTTSTIDIVIDNSTLSSTLPQGTITSPMANGTWWTTSQVAFDVVVTLPANYPLSAAVFEAMGDTTGTMPFFPKICRAEISFAGRGVGCLSTTNPPNTTYLKSSLSSPFNDKASMPLGNFCATTMVPENSTDQTFIVSVVAELPRQTNITAQPTYKMSAGINFSGSLIWVGNTQFNVIGTAFTGATHNVTPMVTNFFKAPVAPGSVQRIPFSIKIPPGAANQFTFTVTSTTPNLQICAVNILTVGTGFPCLDSNPFGKWGPEQTTRLTYTRFNASNPSGGNSAATLEFGVLRNVGTYPLITTSPTDPSTIAVEAIVTLSATAIAPLSLTGQLSWLTAGVSTSAVNFSISGTPTYATVADFDLVMADRDTKVVNGYVLGVAKEVDIDISVKDPTLKVNGKSVGLLIENADPANMPFNICCAAIVYAGQNFPCVNHTGSGFTATNFTTPLNQTIINSITFTAGMLCHMPLIPGNDSSKITVKAYILVDKYNSTFAGSISVKSTLMLDNVATTLTKTLVLAKSTAPIAAGNSTGSVDLAKPPNVTTIGSPIILKAREHGVAAFNVCIPPNDLVAFEPAVLADSDYRARATIVKLWTGTVGQNVACMSDMSAYYIDYFGSQNLTSKTQMDQAVVRTYYARNTGFSYKSATNVTDDDCMIIYAEFELTDHPLNTHNSSFSISVGARVGSLIEVEMQPVIVNRAANEMADIVVNMTVTNSTNTTIYKQNDQVGLSLLVYHNKTSNREAVDPLIRVIYPPYMDYNIAQTVLTNASFYNVTATKNGTTVAFKLPYVLFTDWIQLNFTLTTNPTNMETPTTLNLGLDATTLARVVCMMTAFPSPTTVFPAVNTTYYHCGDIGAATYLVTPVGCPAAPLGMQSQLITDCQITASTAVSEIYAPTKARNGVTGYWAPALNSFEPYLEIHFGNLTEITKISFTFDPTGAAVTGYRVTTSLDGMAFSEAGTGTTAPYIPAQPIITRFIRFVVTNATDSATKLIKLKVEPEGCYRSADLPMTDTCPYVPPTRYTNDKKQWRHAVVDTGNSIVYFCIFHTVKLRTICYSGASAGTVWQTCPSYLGYFAGVDTSVTPNRVIGVDSKDAAYVYSNDGLAWTPMTQAEYNTTIAAAGTFVPSQAVPSDPVVDATPIALNATGWTADNRGIHLSGVQKVDWSTCCN